MNLGGKFGEEMVRGMKGLGVVLPLESILRCFVAVRVFGCPFFALEWAFRLIVVCCI